MNSISFFKALLMKELNEKDLPGNQEKIARAAEPKDKITGADFAALRAKKDVKKEGEDYAFDIAKKLKDEDNMDEDAVYIYLVDEMGLSNMAAQSIVNKLFPQDNLKNEGEDHEVSMAQNSLKSIISSASQLMNMLGQDEKDIPAWIQDHITNAENYINQASKNYHEYNEGNTGEYDMDELPNGTIEKPAGDEEDLDMALQSMMEAKSISIKDFLSVLKQFPENVSKEKVVTAYNKLDAADQPEALKLASGKDVLPTPKKINETSLKSIMETVVKRKKAK
jgi:hypothetical protein